MASEVTPVSEKVAAEAAELQAKAEELTVSAKDAAASAGASGEAAAEEATSRIQKYADRVVDSANKTADSAKEYVSKVVTKVQKYAVSAQASGSTSTTSSLQGALSKAIPVASTGGSEATDQGEDVKFPLSVVTWCSSICGSKVEATSQTSTASLQGAKDQISKGLTDAAAKLEAAKSAGEGQIQTAAEAIKEEAAETVGATSTATPTVA